jgi:SNF2 family DNA or RNA helicase
LKRTPLSGYIASEKVLDIVKNKAVLLKVRDPDRITSVIPKSKLIKSQGENYHEVLVHWGLEEMQVLKNLKIHNVPSPIKGQYVWPGQFKPFEHQKETASFLTLHRKAFVFNEQGTGKTASAIWAADYLMNLGLVKRVLIVCPLSIMDAAWRADLFTFAIHRRVDIAYGNRDKRKKIIEGNAEFVIINYDGIEIVHEAIDEADFDLIIVDEANAYKNPTTNRWKLFNALIKPHTWLWMMTGTPAAQSPVDAYGIAKLVNPTAVPRFFSHFRDQVMQKITMFKWIPKINSEDVVHKVLQPAIRYTKEECLDLPEITYQTREVPLTAQQQKYYDMLRKQMLVRAAGEEITTINAAANLNKLLQLSCGAVYSDTGEIVEFDASNRLKVLKEVIDESSHKVLVFAPFRHAIEVIRESLEKDGYTVDLIHGGVPVNKRTEIFKKFQETLSPRVLIIQPQAASHGVTLHAANTIVWWGPITSYETYAQANARVHRSGQKNPCTVIKLRGSSVEKKLYEALQNKQDIQGSIMALYGELLS